MTTSAEETTTICRTLLSAKEGKATNLCESRDVDSAGRWIVGIDSDKAEHLTVTVAGVVSKLCKNGQIAAENQLADTPSVPNERPKR